MTSEYHSTLIEISQRLSKDDLNNLVYSCEDILPLSTAEQITAGIHLFRELKHRGHLGPANYDYLRKQLMLVGRHDLASMLPDQFEILFGRLTVRDKGYFGCFVSPIFPVTSDCMINASLLDHSQPSSESRILLMQLCQQLSSEDTKKLIYLICPTQSKITALGFAELLEREGGLHSYNVISRLSSSLNAVGRVDLAQQLARLKMTHLPVPSSSLSALQLQLNLKMRLLLHSKQQSFDFYMKALSEVECNVDVRMKLLGPVYARVQTSFSSSNITELIQSLQKNLIAINSGVNFDSLVNKSILEGLKVDQAYSMRNTLLGCQDIPLRKLREVTKQVHDSYITFDSLMDIINWNSSVREDLKSDVKQHRSPFGTPADFACKYILELSQEIGRGSSQEVYAIIDSHIQALNSNYYCCCYHILVLQWLASLLCFFTSFGFGQLDLCKFKETLQCILEQKKDEIAQTYGYISDIVGHAVLQKLIPLPKAKVYENHLPQNEFVIFFNVLVIKLLAAATLEIDQPLSQYYLIDSNEAIQYGSQAIMISAAAMKKQVKAFRERY
jgi:hypothetical protein